MNSGDKIKQATSAKDRCAISQASVDLRGVRLICRFNVRLARRDVEGFCSDMKIYIAQTSIVSTVFVIKTRIPLA